VFDPSDLVARLRCALPIGFALLVLGCAGSRTPGTPTVVYVGETAIAACPATVTIHRRLGEEVVTIRGGGEVVREFIIHREETPRPPGIAYQLFDAAVRDSPHVFVNDLPHERDGSYIVPYARRTVIVEDPFFDVTLIVGN
jgi:hypothetical protein